MAVDHNSLYRSTHNWVERQLGKPQECENCDDTDAKCFDWANISGNYKRDISDWARLCRACHANFDGPRWGGKKKDYCLRGHPLASGNLWVAPSSGYRHCLECKRLYQRKEWRLTRRLTA